MSFSTGKPTAKVKESRFSFTEDRELVVENAVIMWTNFGGNPTKYNPAGGRRTFDLVMTERIAIMLDADGWNIKTIRGKTEDDPTMYVTEIAVNPRSNMSVYLCEEVNGKKYRYRVKPEDLAVLDTYQYSDVALLIHPYVHGRENSAGSTIKGYLRQMNLVRMNEDYFRDRYQEYANEESPTFPPVEEVPVEDVSDGWISAMDPGEIPFS